MLTKLEEIGKLIGGFFYCNACSEKHPTIDGEPEPAPVFTINIGRYSQQCSNCRRLIIHGFKSGNQPLNLLPVKEQDEITLTWEQWVPIKERILSEAHARDFEAAHSLLNATIMKFLVVIVLLDRNETIMEEVPQLAADILGVMKRV